MSYDWLLPLGLIKTRLLKLQLKNGTSMIINTNLCLKLLAVFKGVQSMLG